MLLLRGHAGSVRSLTFSSDGTLLVSAADDRKVRLWDARTGAEHTVLSGHNDCIQAVVFNPKGQHLYSVGDDRILYTWDVVSGTLARVGERGMDRLVALAISPDGDLLAIGGDRPPRGMWDPRISDQPTLRILDLTLGRLIPILPVLERTQAVWSLAFAPVGRTLAIGLSNGQVLLWDFRRSRIVRRLRHSVGVRALVYSPDGQRLVTAPGTPAQVWDLEREEVLHYLGDIKHSIESLAFAPDNVTLATGCLDSTVRLWDTRTGLEKFRFDWQLGRVHTVAIAPDGMTAAAGGENGDIVIWDLDL